MASARNPKTLQGSPQRVAQQPQKITARPKTLIEKSPKKGRNMTYVNERISDEDMDKYKVAQTSWPHCLYSHRNWVIDRERDIYLREAADDLGESTNEYWSFYWKGHEWPVYGYRVSYAPNTDVSRAKKTMRFKFTKFPAELELHIKEIQSNFRDSYCAHAFCIDTDRTFIFE